jgi:hypothetical protein
MLAPETPYPQPGSYALWIDHDPATSRGTELVRIIRHGALTSFVAFPLREGASGNMTVATGDLIDATPLTAAEQLELRDIDQLLDDRDPRNFSKAQRAKAKRRTELKLRIIHGPILDRQLRLARDYAASQNRRAA